MHDRDMISSEYEPEFEGFEPEQYEYRGEAGIYGETVGYMPFEEAEEMELAAELLAIGNEAELDQFLGGLIKKAGRAAGSFVKSPTGRVLGGILKGAAGKALPALGHAAGSYFGRAARGDIGSQLASTAGSYFGLELEGLSPEDQEFEVARRFVRFAGDAAQKAAHAPQDATPQAVAQSAAVSAAQQHAPGLLRPSAASNLAMPCGRRSGRWVRRGRNIVILDC